MDAHRCGICFETFDPDAEPEYAHFEYIATAGHEQAYPDDYPKRASDLEHLAPLAARYDSRQRFLADLTALGGIYRRLWSHQPGGFIAEDLAGGAADAAAVPGQGCG